MRIADCGIRNYIEGDFYVSSSGYKGTSAEGFEIISMKGYGNAGLGQGVLGSRSRFSIRGFSLKQTNRSQMKQRNVPKWNNLLVTLIETQSIKLLADIPTVPF
jgi:hypothetical protein